MDADHLFQCVENIFIAGAPAQMAGDLLPKLLAGIFFAAVNQLHTCQHQAGRAEAALNGRLIATE